MKVTTIGMIAASFLVSGASLIQAQSPEPPRLMRIFREDIKPGRSAAHERTESGFVRAFAKTSYPAYIALDSMTGSTQAWFLERYDSYEALDKAIKVAREEPLKTALPQLDAQDGELRSGERNMIAVYQKDMSYTPVPALGAKARYFTINMVRVRPGHNPEFGEMRKLVNAAFEKSGSKQRRVVYSVTSGAPIGTYLVLSAMESLKTMDPAPGAITMAEAFGTDNLARYGKLQAEIVISSENTLFTINPKMSNPPKEYVAADPDFWAPKPKPAAPATAAKPAAKPAGPQ